MYAGFSKGVSPESPSHSCFLIRKIMGETREPIRENHFQIILYRDLTMLRYTMMFDDIIMFHKCHHNKNTPAFWGKRSPSWQQLVYNFGQPTGVLAQTQGAVKKLLLRLEVSEECEPLQSHALMIRFMKKQKNNLVPGVNVVNQVSCWSIWFCYLLFYDQ